MSMDYKKIAFETFAQRIHKDRVEGMQKHHAELAYPEEVADVRGDPELAKSVGLEWLL